MNEQRNREVSARGKLKTRGYILRKYRVRNPNVNNLGGYSIITLENTLVAGQRSEMSIDDVEDFIIGLDRVEHRF